MYCEKYVKIMAHMLLIIIDTRIYKFVKLLRKVVNMRRYIVEIILAFLRIFVSFVHHLSRVVVWLPTLIVIAA